MVNGSFLRTLGMGLASAVAVTLVQEGLRRVVAETPPLRRGLVRIGKRDGVLRGVGGVVTNPLFYALVGARARRLGWMRGALVGALAGVAAVLLPPLLGFGRWGRGVRAVSRMMNTGFGLAA